MFERKSLPALIAVEERVKDEFKSISFDYIFGNVAGKVAGRLVLGRLEDGVHSDPKEVLHHSWDEAF